MTVGERIRHYREERGMSIANVCEACGICQESLLRWEKDCGQPNAKNLVTLHSVLGVSVDWLLGTKGKYTKYNLQLSIGEKIRRKRGNKTRKEFKGDCWTTTSTIASIENGKTKNMSASTLIDLCAMTGMSVDWLLGIRRNGQMSRRL